MARRLLGKTGENGGKEGRRKMDFFSLSFTSVRCPFFSVCGKRNVRKSKRRPTILFLLLYWKRQQAYRKWVRQRENKMFRLLFSSIVRISFPFFSLCERIRHTERTHGFPLPSHAWIKIQGYSHWQQQWRFWVARTKNEKIKGIRCACVSDKTFVTQKGGGKERCQIFFASPVVTKKLACSVFRGTLCMLPYFAERACHNSPTH